MSKVRAIAFYLPQFHPVPENDEWWGKGFTEWTNVGKAKTYFPGHYQPRVPADLGYYDLRVPEVRENQAALAKEACIEGFCYWHYWFGNGKRLLEKPFTEVLESGKPDYPFCLAWANESWKGFAHGLKNRNVLIEQQYPGEEDYIAHFYTVLPAFKDKRYIKVDGKPVFMIFKPLASDQINIFIDIWNKLAVENNLNGIYFIGQCSNDDDFEKINTLKLDAINTIRLNGCDKKKFLWQRMIINLYRYIFKRPRVVSYKTASKYFIDKNIDSRNNVYPTVISGWDHTPRSGYRGFVLRNFTPEFFKKHLLDAVFVNSKKKDKIIFIKSWNEWAEGNYIEPDLKWGKQFLYTIRDVLNQTSK